jgi:phosphoribosylglycinamide formyltransferase 1
MNLAFLASHGGSNMQAIIDSIKKGLLKANPVLVISNNSNSKALERARNEGIDWCHLSNSTHADTLELDLAIVELLNRHETDLVVLAGYMKKIGDKTLKAFQGRILNIHPALLPKFGGKGMYGMKVHEAVIASGETESGPTVHLIDDQYDNGPILAQYKIPVLKQDTAESLAEKVLKEEHQIYWQTIAKIVSGEIKLAY